MGVDDKWLRGKYPGWNGGQGMVHNFTTAGERGDTYVNVDTIRHFYFDFSKYFLM